MKKYIRILIFLVTCFSIAYPTTGTAVAAESHAGSMPAFAWSFVFQAPQPHMKSIEPYNGKLYLGAFTGQSNGQLLVYDGITLSDAGLTFPGVTVDMVETLKAHDGKLYIGTRVMEGGNAYARVYSYDGVSFTNEFSDTGILGCSGIEAFTVHNGDLYAANGGCGNGKVYHRSASGNWETLGGFVAMGSAARALESFNGWLYAGTGTGEGAGLYRWTGSDWILETDISSIYPGELGIRELAVYNGRLIVGFAGGTSPVPVVAYDGVNWATLGSVAGCTSAEVENIDGLLLSTSCDSMIYAYDGTTWGVDGAVDTPVMDFALLNNEIYAASATSGQVWKRPASGVTTYLVSGMVVDNGGQPVSGVTISDGNGHTVTTISDGTYSLSGLFPGTYVLTPSKTGFTFNPATQQVTITDASISGVNFTADQERLSISGSVVDLGGNPIAGVTISDNSGHSATTGSDGHYVLVGLTSGQYTITPFMEGVGFNPLNRLVNVPPNAVGINFTSSTYIEPLQLTANPGFDRIHVSWDVAPDPNVDAYRVYRATPDATYPFVELELVTDTQFFDQSVELENGQNYCYKVEALDGTAVLATSSVDCAEFGMVELWVPETYTAPSTTVTIPINIRNATGLNVVSADIWLDFDPALLECVEVLNTAMTVNFTWFSNIDNVNGRVRISTIASPAQPINGNGSFFWLTFNVIGNAGEIAPLNLVEFVELVGGSSIQSEVNGNPIPEDVPLQLVDSTFHIDTTGMLGDVDDNGIVAAVDAYLALQMSVGNIIPTWKQQYAADVNGDGVISSADVSMILYYAAHSAWPLPGTKLGSQPADKKMPDTDVVIDVGDVQGLIGQTITVPLNAQGLQNWSGGDWIILFDPNVIDAVTEVKVGELAAGSPLSYSSSGNGRLKISIARNAPVNGSGVLANIKFHIRPDAPFGISPFTLASVRLSDPFGRDFELSALQLTVIRESGSVAVSGSRIFLPAMMR